MPWYVIASLTPALLLGMACLFGGLWPLIALLWVTLAVFGLDRLGRRLPPRPGTARALTLALGLVHFALLALGLWALASPASGLTLANKVLTFIGLSLFFGQISNSNAHELIHAPGRGARAIGAAIYTSLLNGHHVSAHLRVHHPLAATAGDPNSAPAGMGYWRFALRAMTVEFTAGLHAESRLSARSTPPRPPWRHPYLLWISGAALALALSSWLGGLPALIWHLALALYALLQLLLSDYVQHYGLRRAMGTDGRPGPIGPAHSWNAPHWFSGAMMLNAPRHSDHHQRPGQPFPGLRLEPEQMPMLPYPLPVMAVLALVPPIWRRVMDRRARRWQDPARLD